LRPFQEAIEEHVKMIMLGHLNVPALESSGIPVSISKKAVRFLREKMKFKGILITDAMNMGGIGKLSEEKAAFMSLDAGVDILLHPTDPEQVVSYLEAKKNVFDAERLTRFRSELGRGRAGRRPGFEVHGKLSGLLADKAIRLKGDFRIKGDLFLVVLNDDEQSKGIVLARTLKEKIPSAKIRIIRKGQEVEKIRISDNAFVVVAVFSETKAWKGGASDWLCRQIAYAQNRADLFVSFGSPYLLDNINDAKIFAYWDSGSAQRAVARLITKKTTFLLTCKSMETTNIVP
jgi:beta-glucosidase-like glycosyl hydrolase